MIQLIADYGSSIVNPYRNQVREIERTVLKRICRIRSKIAAKYGAESLQSTEWNRCKTRSKNAAKYGTA